MSIKTKYGTASISGNGYYIIKSNEYGFKDCYLHRLIMADKIGCGIPSNYVVHHVDGDKLNNDPANLELLTREEHMSLHGEDKSRVLEAAIKQSQRRSGTSNYFRVCKHKKPECKQGFTWSYRYYECGQRKEISSVDIKKLEGKVRAKGLEWRKLE